MPAISNRPLPPGASVEISKVAEWLQGPKAKYAVSGNTKFCSNSKELAFVTPNLLERFIEEMPKVPLESAVASICFEHPTLIPIDAGWVVNLVPVHDVQGVAIEDHTLYSNHYVQLTKDSIVSGSFYGLLLVFRFDEEEARSRRQRMRNFLKRDLKMT
ncbi:hypothetical protein F5Y09DRAFT_356378 [Xylaria sp. FL1042]|nr:hypothetical protein F5Y09DRAFT_356378 [Xylaria sp. FL1042]